MTKVRIIRNVHNKMKEFYRICNSADCDIIQLGDLGFRNLYVNLILFASTFDYKIN